MYSFIKGSDACLKAHRIRPARASGERVALGRKANHGLEVVEPAHAVAADVSRGAELLEGAPVLGRAGGAVVAFLAADAPLRKHIVLDRLPAQFPLVATNPR